MAQNALAETGEDEIFEQGGERSDWLQPPQTLPAFEVRGQAIPDEQVLRFFGEEEPG